MQKLPVSVWLARMRWVLPLCQAGEMMLRRQLPELAHADAMLLCQVLLWLLHGQRRLRVPVVSVWIVRYTLRRAIHAR